MRGIALFLIKSLDFCRYLGLYSKIKVSKGSEIYQDALKLSVIGYGPMDALILDYYLEETTFDRRHWSAIQEARKSWRF